MFYFIAVCRRSIATLRNGWFFPQEYFDEKLVGIWFQKYKCCLHFVWQEVCFKVKDGATSEKAQINWTNFGEELLFMEDSGGKELTEIGMIFFFLISKLLYNLTLR